MGKIASRFITGVKAKPKSKSKPKPKAKPIPKSKAFERRKNKLKNQ